jgi:hypothetical protein
MSRPTILVLAMTALAPLAAGAQQPGDKKPPAKATSQAPPAEVLEAMTPGPAHQELARLAGDYQTLTRFRIAPGAPPVESSGTAKLVMILDGRFLREENAGTTMGQPYFGMRLVGYNNGSKKYEGIWTYTMSTSMMSLSGASPDGGKTIDFVATFDNPAGVRESLQIVQRRLDDDRFVVELVGNNPDGTPGPRLETTYTRKR